MCEGFFGLGGLGASKGRARPRGRESRGKFVRLWRGAGTGRAGELIRDSARPTLFRAAGGFFEKKFFARPEFFRPPQVFLKADS
jgi:hypothetical protein